MDPHQVNQTFKYCDKQCCTEHGLSTTSTKVLLFTSCDPSTSPIRSHLVYSTLCGLTWGILPHESDRLYSSHIRSSMMLRVLKKFILINYLKRFFDDIHRNSHVQFEAHFIWMIHCLYWSKENIDINSKHWLFVFGLCKCGLLWA